MMSYTSPEVKNRYMSKAYDRINIIVPKGERTRIKAEAEREGKSVNRYIIDLIYNNMNTPPPRT